MNVQARQPSRARLPLALLAAVAALTFTFGAGAAQAQLASAGPIYGGTLRVAFTGNMVTFDPAQAYVDDWFIMNGTLFNGLYQFDRDGRPQLDLAAAPPTISADRKTWTFKIKKGVSFTNGMELTADDVAYTLQRVLDPHLKPAPSWGQSAAAVYQGSAAYIAGKARSVAGIQVVDRYTIRLVLTSPVAVLPDLLAASYNLVVPKAVVEKEGSIYFASHPIGTGPYILQSWTKGAALVFVKNRRYFHAGKPYIDKILVWDNQSPSVIALKVEKGELTAFGAASEIDAADLQRFKGDPKLASYLVPTPDVEVRWLSMNVHNPPLDSATLRQAIAMAINRTRLVRLLGGAAVPAYQFFIALDPQHDPSLDSHAVYPYDPSKAAALVKASGYHGQQLTLTYASDQVIDAGMVPGIQQQLQQIGLNVTLRGVTDSELLALAAPLKGLQLSFDGWSVDFPDAYDFYNGVLQCSNNIAPGTQAAHYCDPTADALVSRAEVLPLGADRNALFRRAQLRLLKAAERVPLVHQHVPEIVSPKIGGFYYEPMFGWQIENYWLKP